MKVPAFLLTVLCLGGASLASAGAPATAPATASAPAGSRADVRRGWRVFVAKSCSRCHAVWGHGGTLVEPAARRPVSRRDELRRRRGGVHRGQR